MNFKTTTTENYFVQKLVTDTPKKNNNSHKNKK